MVFHGQFVGEVHFILTYISNDYLTTRNGIYYFQRRVPVDVRSHYKSYSIAFSLKTRTRKIALRAASSLSFQLDEYWMTLRVNQLASIHCKKLQTSFNNTSSGATFSDAKDLYLKLKGQGKGESFVVYTERNFGYLIEAVGNKDLIDYKPADGGVFRDWLIKKGLSSSSVKRVFSTIRAITNLAIAEYGLDMRSPFANVYFPELDDIKERLPVSPNDIKLIQRHCRETNDEMRWLLALISDTGMRLAEAAGLALNDIVLDSEIPYINLKPNDSRRLKTKKSSRKIPLIGSSLWAAQQVKSEFNGTYAFPRYTKGGKCNANSASAALNKWLKQIASESVTVHSFRHSLTDRLRAVQCPRDIIDAIGGWTAGSIGEKYGEGYKLDVLHEWMLKLVIK
jgi:integrase